jgi:hypothetical protein
VKAPCPIVELAKSVVCKSHQLSYLAGVAISPHKRTELGDFGPKAEAVPKGLLLSVQLKCKNVNPYSMFAKLKNSFWAISIVCCYPLYAIGQMWLFISDRQEGDFYKLITQHGNAWVNAHLILMLSLLLLIPAYLAINNYLKDSKGYYWGNLGTFFLCLAVFVLFGQFTIDLCLVDIFHLPEDKAYAVLDNIQANAIIKPLFYDNSKIFFLFKIVDFWSLAHICIITGLILAKKLPKWAVVIFILAMLFTTFAILIHPVYGRIIKRCSYALFSVSLLPIALQLLKGKKLGLG